MTKNHVNNFPISLAKTDVGVRLYIQTTEAISEYCLALQKLIKSQVFLKISTGLHRDPPEQGTLADLYNTDDGLLKAQALSFPFRNYKSRMIEIRK